MAASRVFHRILIGAGFAVVGLYTLIDQVAGPVFRPVVRVLVRSSPIAGLRRASGHLSAGAALVALLVPFVAAEPAKIYGLILIADGHVTTGAVTIALAYLVSLLLVDTIYDGARPQLRSIRWFAAVVDWLSTLKMVILDRVRAMAAYRVVAEWAAELRARLGNAFQRARLTRPSARVSRRGDAFTDKANP